LEGAGEPTFALKEIQGSGKENIATEGGSFIYSKSGEHHAR
jgi:hypothetical protein